MSNARTIRQSLCCLLVAFLSYGVLWFPADCARGADPGRLQDQENEDTVSTGETDSDAATRYRPAEKEPEWVSETETRPSTRRLVTSDFRHREREAEEELWDSLIETVRRELDERVASGAGDIIPLDRKALRKQFVPADRWHVHLYYTAVPGGELAEGFGVVDARDGKRYLEWYRCFAEIEVGDEFLSWGREEYEVQLVNSRVRQSLLVVFGVLALFAGTFGLLRLNHQTRGLYRGKLIVLATVLLIVLAVVAFAICDSMVWL
jgi:hypothetical protein